MPNYDELKNFIYHVMVDKGYKSYFCSNNANGVNNCPETGECYICVFNDDSMVVYTNYIMKAKQTYLFVDGVQKGGSTLSATARVNGIVKENVISNHKGSNGLVQISSKDILLDTPYYSNLKLLDIKESIPVNSDTSSSPSISMDDTNTILLTILLVLCVMFIHSFLRKIFNRGVL